MKANIDWKGGMLLEGKNAEGMSTYFDTHHPEQKHGTPMEIMLRWRSCFKRWDLVP